MLILTLVISIISTVVVWQSMDCASKSSKNDGALTAIYQAIAGGSLLLFIPFDELKFATNWKVWLMFAIACVFYAINDRIMTTLYRNLSASHVSVLKQLSSVFVIMIGLFVFKEPFSIGNIIAAVMIIVGNVMILYQRNKETTNRSRILPYVILGIIANVAMSIALSVDIDISNHYNLAIYAALSLLIPSLIIIVGDKDVSFKAMKQEIVTGNKKAIFAASIAQGLQIFTMLKSYQLGNIIIVAPLLSLSVLLNALYELVFLKRTDRWKIKIAVSIMIFVAVILTSV